MTTTTSLASSGRNSHSHSSLFSSLNISAAFQLFGGIIVAIWLPLVVRVLAGDLDWTNRWLYQTALAGCIALVIGFLIYRRVANFPGAQAVRGIVFSLTATFGISMLLISFMHIDYSRYQFAISYIVSIAWFVGIFFVTRRFRPLRFLLVPTRCANRLMTIPGVEWVILKSPELRNVSCTGVVVDHRSELSDQWQRFITETTLAGIQVFDCRQVHEYLTGRVDIGHLSADKLGSLIPSRVYVEVKLVVDWMAALVILALLLPFLLATALAIRIDSPGPVIYRQKRVGYRGKIFTLFKFRTTADSVRTGEHQQDQAPAEYGDRRITTVGKFLRRHRIDALPQIVNILRGEMSWIGPIPESVPDFEWYQNELPFYRYRLIVRPGLCDWAQGNQEYVAEKDNVCGRLRYDFYYIKNYSPWLDLLILLRAIGSLLSGFGAR